MRKCSLSRPIIHLLRTWSDYVFGQEQFEHNLWSRNGVALGAGSATCEISLRLQSALRALDVPVWVYKHVSYALPIFSTILSAIYQKQRKMAGKLLVECLCMTEQSSVTDVSMMHGHSLFRGFAAEWFCFVLWHSLWCMETTKQTTARCLRPLVQSWVFAFFPNCFDTTLHYSRRRRHLYHRRHRLRRYRVYWLSSNGIIS